MRSDIRGGASDLSTGGWRTRVLRAIHRQSGDRSYIGRKFLFPSAKVRSTRSPVGNRQLFSGMPVISSHLPTNRSLEQPSASLIRNTYKNCSDRFPAVSSYIEVKPFDRVEPSVTLTGAVVLVLIILT